MADDVTMWWFLDLPEKDEASFREQVEDLGGIVMCTAGFPGEPRRVSRMLLIL